MEIRCGRLHDGNMGSHTTRSIPTLLLISAATIALAGCGLDVTIGDGADREVRRDTVAVDNATTVDISTGNGAIEIEPGAPGAVEVETIVVASRPSDASVTISNDGDRVEVDGDCDSSFWRECQIGFVVSVPPDLDVTVRTSNGRIEITGVDGRLSAASDNGAIVGSALRAAETDVRTSNGAIDLSFGMAPDVLDLETNNGSIDVRIPSDDDAYDVDVATHNGGLDIDVHDHPGADRTIRARSDNGSIEIGYLAG